MSDPTFDDAIAGRTWIADPDPWASVEPGWAAIFTEALDRVGAVVARHPDLVVTGLTAKEKMGTLRIGTYTRLPSDVADEVGAVWREAEERSTVTCQVCGAPGTLRTDRRHWWATTCDDHV